jgi:hypothetical protein
MAKANETRNYSTWPQEGIPLLGATAQLADKTVGEVIEAITAYATRELVESLIDGEPTAPTPLQAAGEVLVATLVKALDVETLELRGRPGSPFAERISLPPPKSGWRLRIQDLDRSVINAIPVSQVFDATPGSQVVFDVRLYVAGAKVAESAAETAAAAGEVVEQTKMAASEWLPLELERNPIRQGEAQADYIDRIWGQLLQASNVRPVSKKTVQNIYSAWLKGESKR